jgi:hypothetical protein
LSGEVSDRHGQGFPPVVDLQGPGQRLAAPVGHGESDAVVPAGAVNHRTDAVEPPQHREVPDPPAPVQYGGSDPDDRRMPGDDRLVAVGHVGLAGA